MLPAPRPAGNGREAASRASPARRGQPGAASPARPEAYWDAVRYASALAGV